MDFLLDEGLDGRCGRLRGAEPAAAGRVHEIRRYERARMTDRRKPYCAPRWSSASRRSGTPPSSCTTGGRCSPPTVDRGSAYFGSWGLSHPIPAAQDAAIRAAGTCGSPTGIPTTSTRLPPAAPRHPDPPARPRGRPHREDLARDGYRVEVLADRRGCSSPTGSGCCASPTRPGRGAADRRRRPVGGEPQRRGGPRVGSLVKRVIRAFPRSFLLRLSGYGDADMINFVDEDGAPRPSLAPLRRRRFRGRCRRRAHGRDLRREPFRAVQLDPPLPTHRQRVGEPLDHPVADYSRGFRSDRVELLPAFVRYDCTTDTWEAIDPPAAPDLAFPPEEFGDDWSDAARADAICSRSRRYFGAIAHLARHSTSSPSASAAASTRSSSAGATPGAPSRSRRRVRR